jgi:hypothetical protein
VVTLHLTLRGGAEISTSLSFVKGGSVVEYNRPSISGTALIGRKTIRGRFCVRSDSFRRQNVPRLEEYPVSESFTRNVFPIAYRSLTVDLFFPI